MPIVSGSERTKWLLEFLLMGSGAWVLTRSRRSDGWEALVITRTDCIVFCFNCKWVPDILA